MPQPRLPGTRPMEKFLPWPSVAASSQSANWAHRKCADVSLRGHAAPKHLQATRHAGAALGLVLGVGGHPLHLAEVFLRDAGDPAALAIDRLAIKALDHAHGSQPRDQ